MLKHCNKRDIINKYYSIIINLNERINNSTISGKKEVVQFLDAEFAKSASLKHNIEICTLDATNQGYRIANVDNIKVTYLKLRRGLNG